jgi:hypothetical protein
MKLIILVRTVSDIISQVLERLLCYALCVIYCKEKRLRFKDFTLKKCEQMGEESGSTSLLFQIGCLEPNLQELGIFSFFNTCIDLYR